MITLKIFVISLIFMYLFTVISSVKFKAKIKCLDYSKFVRGCPSIANDFIFSRKVRVLHKEFPHLGFIGYKNHTAKSYTWACGGALISRQHVLIAAHCADSMLLGPPRVVKFGTTRYTESYLNHQVQMINVTAVIVHPEYNAPSAYNDIAVLRLEKKVQVTTYVRPACLHSDFNVPFTNAVTASWGTQDEYRLKQEEVRKITHEIVPQDKCNISYSTASYFRLSKGISWDTQLCAATDVYENIDDCKYSDIGGPLQVVHPKIKCMYIVIGVASFGRHCASKEYPNVFTKVSGFIPWIESVVWKETKSLYY